MDKFNLLLVDISSIIYEEELKTLKFLCNDEFGRRILEEMTDPCDLWIKLKEKCLIKANDISYLKKLIKNGLPNRTDILEKLESYEPTYGQLADQHGLEFSKEIEVICEHLPVKCIKMFARKLGLRDPEIDNIVINIAPHNAKEQLYRIVRLSMDKRKITKQELVETLKECKCNLIAEQLSSIH